MSGPDEKHPKRWKWRIEWLFQTGMECVLGSLPGPLAFRMGALLGRLAWYLLPQRRRTVMRNLRIAYCGKHDLPALRQLAKESFRRTGANLISTAHTARLAPDRLGTVIDIENLDLLEQTLTGGKGLVLLLAHMGNWEILSRIVHLFPKGSRTGAFYRPLNNPLLDADVLKRRQADGTRMFSKRDSPHHVAGFLREGGIVGILADQRVGAQGDVVSFFGRLTAASSLPGLLARRAKCPVLALSLTTRAPGKWQARFVPAGMRRDTADCMAALEQAMQAGPDDVFWLQDRWKVYVTADYTIRDWLGADPPPSEKPHRALVWLADAPGGWQLPGAWLHPDVIYEVVLASGGERPAWLERDTPVHFAASNSPRDALRKVLDAIDAAAPLPLDFIVTCGASAALTKAVRRMGITLVSLPATSVDTSSANPPP